MIVLLIKFIAGSLQRNVRQVMALEGTAVAKLERLFAMHVKLLQEETAIPRILYCLIGSDRNPELKAGMVAVVGRYMQQVRKIVAQGQKQGEISADIDSTAAAMLFLGMLQPLAIFGQINPNISSAWRHSTLSLHCQPAARCVRSLRGRICFFDKDSVQTMYIVVSGLVSLCKFNPQFNGIGSVMHENYAVE